MTATHKSKSLTTNQTIKLLASIIEGNGCERCDGITHNSENEYGEFICDDCTQNAAEAASERHCEAFHDGGSTQFVSLQQQQINALKFK